MTHRVKPELMSPAGHWPQLHAAIEAGADAVYFGLKHFSARAKVGFTTAELPQVMQTLHRRAVKGFVTFNTLVFDHEWELAQQAIIELASAGVDAVIVQDVGVARMIHDIAPDLEIHGSTQMSITSAQGAELAKTLGCSRVVLGRELSLKDMRRIAGQTNVELEVFVHGALCVSYSGQCFSSEAWGGRSANRGKCAQACRLSYDLIVDGQMRDLGAARYLISPGDLYALEQVPDLVDIGIHCLKIEGRYKDENYVALTTRAYRQAIDAAWENRDHTISDDDRRDLEQIYSRGLGDHFISGVNHQTVVNARAPRHRGVQVGHVVAVGGNSLIVKLAARQSIAAGDGLVFDAAQWRSPEEPEEGGNVYEVTPDSNNQVELSFGHGEIEFSRIRSGDWVWRTRDPKLAKKLKPITQPGSPRYTRPIGFEVSASPNQPLVITATAEDHSARFESESELQAARNQGLTEPKLREQLGRLGGTPFHLESLEFKNENESPVFVPVSVLNDARRKLVQQILDQRESIAEVRINPITSSAPLAVAKTVENRVDETTTTPRLHLLVRNPEQLTAAIEVAPDSITLDYLELYGLKPSVAKIKEAGLTPRVASPRILKPSEQNVVRFLLGLECPILVRSGGLLQDLVFNLLADVPADQRPELIGDFSLNMANRHSLNVYLEMGMQRIAPTYDLNSQQITELCQATDPQRIEVIAYSHLPVFHTEHCVFCRFLSDGTDHTNCGHPCEKHRIAVQDPEGRQHPVMADVGCRNTIFGAQAQTDPVAVEQWLNAGIRDFRIEYVHQNAAQVLTIANSFSNFLAGKLPTAELERQLTNASPQGTTSGSLYVPKDFKNLVQLS